MVLEIAEGSDMLRYESVKPLAGDRKFTPFVSCQVNSAIRFLCRFLTIHEANESMKNIL